MFRYSLADGQRSWASGSSASGASSASPRELAMVPSKSRSRTFVVACVALIITSAGCDNGAGVSDSPDATISLREEASIRGVVIEPIRMDEPQGAESDCFNGSSFQSDE